MTALPAQPLQHTPPGHLQLRRAVPNDALCLSVLAMQVFLDTYATAGIRPAIAREVLAAYSPAVFDAAIDASINAANCGSGSRVIVAELSGHLIGFAQLTLLASQPLVPPGVQAELLHLYVQEPFTDAKKGIKVGTKLLSAAEQLAASAGASVLWLTSWVHNQRARAFYAKRGYQDYGLTYHRFEDEAHENRVLAKSLG